MLHLLGAETEKRVEEDGKHCSLVLKDLVAVYQLL